MRHLYDALLNSLADEIGLDAPSLLATEEILIDSLPISLQLQGTDDRAEVLLCCPIGAAPVERWPQVARTLLWANHAGTGTCGGTLGVVPEKDTVTLTTRRSLQSLDTEKLAALLGWMANAGLAWKEYVSSEAPAEPPELFQMQQLGSYA